MAGNERMGWRARAFTALLVLAIVGCGIGEADAWPLTGTHLFSGRRTSTRSVVRLLEVRDDGTATPLDLSRVPNRLGLPRHLMASLATAPPAERRRTLEAWASAADPDPQGRPVVALRGVRVLVRVPTHAGEPEVDLSSTMLVEVAR